MKSLRTILSFMILLLATQSLWASGHTQGRVQLQRDEAFEQNLRWAASADKAVTPTKVLRWMKGYRGSSLAAPSKTEFQPIFNANNGHVRIIAAIAVKF